MTEEEVYRDSSPSEQLTTSECSEAGWKDISKLNFLYCTANCLPQDSWQSFAGNVTGQNVWPSLITLHYVTVFNIYNLLYREIRSRSRTQNYTVLIPYKDNILQSPGCSCFQLIFVYCHLWSWEGVASKCWYLSNLSLTDPFDY